MNVFVIQPGKGTAITEQFYKGMVNLALEEGVRMKFSTVMLAKGNKKEDRRRRKDTRYEGVQAVKENLSHAGMEEQVVELLLLRVDTLLGKIFMQPEKQTYKEKDIYMVKKELEGLVISTKDKNKEQLYVECPLLYQARLEQNTEDKLVFEEVDEERDVMEEVKREWKEKGLQRYGGWLQGTTPYMYVIPKEKDPVNKTRLIASYYNHPLRALFKKVGKILQWGLGQLREVKQFTLLSMADLKNRVKKAKSWLKGSYKEDTAAICIQTDIKQMFTYLDVEHIRKAVEWFLEKLVSKEKKRSK